jgi:integrase/recombinase XerD
MDKSIEQMGQDLAHGRYSESTQGQYIRSAKELGAYFGRPVAELGRDDLRAYVGHLWARGMSASWLKMKLGAIVFLYAKTLGRPADVSFVVWPRQYSPLPMVLSLDEMAVFLGALQHPLYRAIAMVLYGAGLRIDEALSLEVKDIDGERGVIRVRHGKGDRAREARLSPSLLEYLRGFWVMAHPPRPYLFVSRLTGRPPMQDSVRRAFALAAEQAGITKRVTPHVLRHSYATTLLEQGTDIRVIQALLGHRSLQTTMRYTRVTTALVQKVPSPIDLLPSRGRVRR